MGPEIICAMISAAGMIASALISYAVARHKTEKEIQKMKLEWARKDDESTDAAFTDMTVAVSLFLSDPSDQNRESAIRCLAVARAAESGKIAQSLDELDSDIQSADLDSLKFDLNCAMRHKREQKRHHGAADGQQPRKRQ